MWKWKYYYFNKMIIEFRKIESDERWRWRVRWVKWIGEVLKLNLLTLDVMCKRKEWCSLMANVMRMNGNEHSKANAEYSECSYNVLCTLIYNHQLYRHSLTQTASIFHRRFIFALKYYNHVSPGINVWEKIQIIVQRGTATWP